MADALTDILRAASKHPNSRVSKLIHTVEEEPTQKNIVLLLIELAEHAEYSTDFNVSLKYYLDLFERLGINDLVLNEAGLLLVNSSKIYSKRVDYVQSLVERQILTLSNADDELQKQKLEQQQSENASSSSPATEKPKRGRKRALEVPTDPYEVELAPKKFKKLTEEKRFAQPKTPPKPKSLQRNIEMEQYIHPAGWQYATIYDLENEEDVDTKRNYKLFTYHIEHRYNTLVPDINFRLHFKVKDYIDEQEEMEENEACNTDRTWPPLSEAYVEKYLRLENYVLQQDVKANKRKATEMEEYDVNKSNEEKKLLKDDTLDDSNHTEDDLVNESQENLNVTNINEKTQLENSAVNTTTSEETNVANTTQENLDTTNLNVKNDSGLGQSILDETNNTLDNTQLNSTLENSAIPENLNDTSLEANKSLNTTETSQENDSALGSSVLDQTGNTENNTTLETTGNLNSSTEGENLNDTKQTEADKSLDVSANPQENDSALDGSVLDQTGNTESNTTLETSKEMETTQESVTETTAETSAILETTQNEGEELKATNGDGEEMKTQNAEEQLKTAENPKESSAILESTQKEGEDLNAVGVEAQIQNAEEQGKATENRKDSALSDDRYRHSISTENLTMSRESLNKIDEEPEKLLSLDVKQQDKDTTQISVQLPHADDEGVCLSDLEDHNDCRLLSPIVKATNILPGVERKDVTIYMDEELRQALEMRDGIMEHFGPETYKVPVVTEAKKHNLIFNIFKLPEKVVRRKILFKLGPEMDLFLQARSLKRVRPEPLTTRNYRNFQLLQWHSLNNTDMTGICMTPPASPGHCSDFCGFSDIDENELDNDDTISCADFCGFTEEEQSNRIVQHISRLSRDSGVGVDVNTLTPEKEPMEIIFEDAESLAVENCKRTLNLNETAEPSTESLLNQLPEEIRDVLTTELEENIENKATENAENKETDEAKTQGEIANNTEESLATNSEGSKENSQETEQLNTESSLENSQETEQLNTESSLGNTQETEKISSEETSSEDAEKLLTESSLENTESSTENNTQETESNVLTENSTEELQTTESSAENTETLAVSESQDKCSDNNTESANPKETIGEIVTAGVTTEESSKSAEELMKEKLDLANSMDINDDFDNDHHDEDTADSDDEEMLDLETQGTKTKIQQWHEHLQPILAKSRERHHFDVFKLGTEIIDTVQNKTLTTQEPANEFTSPSIPPSKPETSFHDIMDNKDQSYVSRYFLSTLLLANQGNIEISINNKSSEKPSSWHDIQLKLLSTKRHTVAIEDNIGMIDNKKQTTAAANKDKNSKKKNRNSTPQFPEDNEEDEEPLIKLQNSTKSPKRSKNSTKRSSNNNSPIAEKKSKQITFPTTTTTTTETTSRHNKLPNLIESVQIIKAPAPQTATQLTNVMDIIMEKPCTSQQAQQFLTPTVFNVNIDAVKTLKPIEKVQKRSDDYDSGIFSIDDMSTS